jgi:hypothetical protein
VLNVTVNPQPAGLTLVTTFEAAAICLGQSATLTASMTPISGASYSIDNNLWQTTPEFNVSPPSDESYTLYVQTSAGCTATLPNAVTIKVNPLPKDPTTPSSNSRCGSGTVTFSASAAGNMIDWYDALTGGSTVTGGYDALSFSPSIGSSTTYYAQARNTSGCVSAARLPVTGMVNPVPDTPTGASANSRCGSGTVTFSASAAGNTIDWYTLASGGSTVTGGYNVLSFSPSIGSSTTYYAQARNSSGCVSASRLPVTGTVNQLPGVPTGASANSRCGSGTITFSANAAGNTIDWYTLASGGSTVTDGYGKTSFSPSINASTTYYAQARNTNTNCVSTSRLPVGATVATQQSGNNEAKNACGCASGLLDCSGTCKTDCCSDCASFTSCNGFSMMTDRNLERGGDNGLMNWSTANSVCTSKGTGWRLPTSSELLCLDLNYIAPNVPGGWVSGEYWSSTASSSGHLTVYITQAGAGWTNDKSNSDTNYIKCVK